jgi:two-component system chemotaxis response regulator CheB
MAERSTEGRRDIVVVGASAGGVEALSRLIASLPADFPAAVFVVLHVSPGGSVLPAILGRAGRLPVTHAVDGEPIDEGRVYVAPPDRHLLVEPGRVRVIGGPRQNGHRPGIDPLFRTAAWAYGSRVVGVVLTGTLDDGALGCRSIKARGGVTLVQDPDEAAYGSMPENAIRYDQPDAVAPVDEIAETLIDLANGAGQTESEAAVDDPPPIEALEGDEERQTNGRVSPYVCPECSGTLWEIGEGAEGLVRFRCRVGHAYSADTMDLAQGTAVETALWTALRALEERVQLKRMLAERVGKRSVAHARRLEHDAVVAEEQAAVVRSVLDDIHAPAPSEEPVVGG